MDSKVLTDAEIDRLLELEAKATPETVVAYEETCGKADCREYNLRGVPRGFHGMFLEQADAELFAAARNSICPLAEEVKRSRARIEAAPHAEQAATLLDECAYHLTEHDREYHHATPKDIYGRIVSTVAALRAADPVRADTECTDEEFTAAWKAAQYIAASKIGPGAGYHPDAVKQARALIHAQNRVNRYYSEAMKAVRADPVREELLAAASALATALETCHVCSTTLLVEDGPMYCEDGCSSDCEDHAEPNCTPISQIHARLKRAIARAESAAHAQAEGTPE